MEAYKTPDSPIDRPENNHTPIKGMLKSFLIAVVVLSIVSVGYTIIFGAMLGADLSEPDSPNSFANTNYLYLITSLIIGSAILFWSGLVLGKHLYINRTEWTTALTMAVLGVFYIPIMLWGLEIYSPAWYQAVSFISIPLFIWLGVKKSE